MHFDFSWKRFTKADLDFHNLFVIFVCCEAQNMHILHSLKACFWAESLSKSELDWCPTSSNRRFHGPMTFFFITIFSKSTQSDNYLHTQHFGWILDFEISVLTHIFSHAMLAPSSNTFMCHLHFWYHFKAESVLYTSAAFKSIHKQTFLNILSDNMWNTFEMPLFILYSPFHTVTKHVNHIEFGM